MLVELLLYFFLAFVIIWPKQNLIDIPNSSVGIRTEDLLIGLIFAVLLVVSVRKGKIKQMVSDRLTWLWLFFLALSGIVTLLGVYVFGTVEYANLGALYWGRYLEFFVIYLAIRNLPLKKMTTGKLLAVLFFCTLLVVLYGLFQIKGWVPYFSTLQSLGTKRVLYKTTGVIMSTFAGHYDFGIFLAFVSCFGWVFLTYCLKKKIAWQGSCAARMRGVKRFLPLLFALFLALVLVALVLSKARSAFIAILVALMCWGLLYNRFYTLLASSILAFLGYLYVKGKLSNSFGKIMIWGRTLRLDKSTVERLTKWINMFSALSIGSLLFGHGLSSYGEALDGFYVRLIGEVGLAGLSLFGVILYHVLRTSHRIMRDQEADVWHRMFAESIFLGTIAVSAQAMFIDTFVSTKIMFVYWLCVGWMMRTGQKIKKVTK